MARTPCPQTLRAIDRELVRATLVHAKDAISGPPGYLADVIQATLNEFRREIRKSQGQPTRGTPYRDTSFVICPLRVYYVVHRHRQRLQSEWAS